MENELRKALNEIANGYIGDLTAEDQFIWAQQRAKAALDIKQVISEPVAWKYELAYFKNNDGTYHGWSIPKVSFCKPNVPEGSIRNLTPLYAFPVIE